MWVITNFNRSSHWKVLWKISVLGILEENKLKPLENMCGEIHFKWSCRIFQGFYLHFKNAVFTQPCSPLHTHTHTYTHAPPCTDSSPSHQILRSPCPPIGGMQAPWPVWLNCWVFVYELSGCGFESSCSHLNFRFRACFEQGVPWHSGNYSVDSLWNVPVWHDKNIQSNV